MSHRRFFSKDPEHWMSYENYIKDLQRYIENDVDTILLMEQTIRKLTHQKGTGEVEPEKADNMIAIAKDIIKSVSQTLKDTRKELEDA